ncbi:translation protein SH3-like domain-containing protein [Lanmaoa asiatica]|nr:translation protein SH3-like domain-containing protein [Lanmaoa asiatica]
MVCAPQLYSSIASHRRYPAHPLDTTLKTDIDDADTVSPLKTFLVVAADSNNAALKMPHSFGYRARTRDMFKRGFKKHGPVKLSTYLINYRVGDIVDIKANAAQQKGMPHKYYHGSVRFIRTLAGYFYLNPENRRRTGIVYNVTPHAVGVIVYKVVGNRYIEKRVNLRVEHVKHSKCRQEFLDRVKRNHDAHVAAKEKGERVSLKRVHALPREAHIVSIAENAPQTMVPVPYETTI